MKLNPEQITQYISAAEGAYDVSSSVHRIEQPLIVISWLLESISCSLMAIARILAYRDSHGDD